MKDDSWMIYGATGRSGQLIARKAVAHGMRPILAGRNKEAIQKFAEELNLSWRAFEIGDWKKFKDEVARVSLLVNAAGPFVNSAVLIAEACLEVSTHYFDLNNEIASLAAVYTLDAEAKEKRLMLLPGLAFSPAASNFLVKHLHTLLPDADSLNVALRPYMRSDGVGANLTILETIASGAFRRRDGNLERYRINSSLAQVELPDGVYTLLPASLGDLEAAFRCTSIPNITTHLVAGMLPSSDGARAVVDPFAKGENLSLGSGNRKPNHGGSMVWARMSKTGRNPLEGWLVLGEGYDFTAAVVVGGVAQFLEERKPSSGAHTAATALGADFVLNLPNVERRVKSHDH